MTDEKRSQIADEILEETMKRHRRTIKSLDNNTPLNIDKEQEADRQAAVSIKALMYHIHKDQVSISRESLKNRAAIALERLED